VKKVRIEPLGQMQPLDIDIGSSCSKGRSSSDDTLAGDQLRE